MLRENKELGCHVRASRKAAGGKDGQMWGAHELGHLRDAEEAGSRESLALPARRG